MPEQIWVEGASLGTFDLKLEIQSGPAAAEALFTGMVNPGPGAATTDQDTISLGVATLDLDMDSDNNNGLGLPARSDWEEFLEVHPYGLGKLVLQTYGTDDPGEDAPNFTPMVLYLGPGLSGPAVKVQFAFDPITSAGKIELWNFDKAEIVGNDTYQIFPATQYSLNDMQYDPESGTAIVYVAGLAEATGVKTLRGVDTNGKPDERITAMLLLNGEAAGGGEMSDEVKYIVVQPDSFYSHLQSRAEVRSAIASKGVYGKADIPSDFPSDMPQFAQQRLSPEALIDLGVPRHIAALFGRNNGIPGFKAAIYQDFTQGPDTFILSFAGTDGTSLDDWDDNIWQGTGEYAQQYEKAMEVGFALANVDRVAGNLVVTGHSLGGGLASAASVVGDFSYRTFNAAGLNRNTLLDGNGNERYEGSLHRFDTPFGLAYAVDWDLLTYYQEEYTPAIPVAVGVKVVLDGPHDISTSAFNAIDFFAPSPWNWFGTGGAIVTMALSHRIDEVLWSLLQVGGDNISGYSYPP